MSGLPEKMPPEKIKWLAEQFDQQQVLTWLNVPPSIIGQIFLPITFGAMKDYTEEQVESICVFGLLDDATPISVNGYPTFFTCHIWLRTDVVKAALLAEAMAEAKRKVLEAAE